MMVNMSHKTPGTIYLKDYKTPAYLVEQVELKFDLYDSATLVTSTLDIYLNPDRNGVVEPLILDGEQLELLGVELAGKILVIIIIFRMM